MWRRACVSRRGDRCMDVRNSRDDRELADEPPRRFVLGARLGRGPIDLFAFCDRARQIRPTSAGSSVPHLLGQPDDGALYGHARGVCGRLAEQIGNLLVGVPQLDARHDGLPLFLAQRGERALIALDRFVPNRFLQRRPAAILQLRIELARFRPALRAPQLVANPIEDRLPQVPNRAPSPRDSNLSIF